MRTTWIFTFIFITFHPHIAVGALPPTKAQQQMMLEQQRQQQLQQQRAMEEPYIEPRVEDIVDIKELWKQFETSSQAWALIIDPEAKVATVAHYIAGFKKDGVKIRKDPAYYAQMIDSMAEQSPDMLQNPFSQIMTMVAILEYDYGNGKDPDEMARKFLNKDQYLENRRRLGLR